MRMHYQHWIFRLPFFRRYAAITAPWGVYFWQAREDVPDWLMRHELTHVRQMSERGIVRYVVQYACEYLRGLWLYRDHWRAYASVSFEREAEASEVV